MGRRGVSQNASVLVVLVLSSFHGLIGHVNLEGITGITTLVPYLEVRSLQLISRALQNNLAKIHNARNHIYVENFKLKLCMCAQSMALGTRTKFQLEILIRSTISAIHKFRENILESSRNVSETTPRCLILKWVAETTWCTRIEAPGMTVREHVPLWSSETIWHLGHASQWPDGTKPLSEPVMTYHEWYLMTICMNTISVKWDDFQMNMLFNSLWPSDDRSRHWIK